MIDHKTVCREIEEARDWGMTRENVMSLAALLYIKEHMEESEHDWHDEHMELTEAEAEEWVSGMENADGTQGAYYAVGETDAFRGELPSTDFWAAMNMMKSDYGVVARMFSVDVPAFYAELARAFLNDRDAEPGKLWRYHKYV